MNCDNKIWKSRNENAFGIFVIFIIFISLQKMTRILMTHLLKILDKKYVKSSKKAEHFNFKHLCAHSFVFMLAEMNLFFFFHIFQ